MTDELSPTQKNEYPGNSAELASMWNVEQSIVGAVRDEAMEQEQDGEDEELAEIKQPPPPQSRVYSRSGQRSL